MPTTPENAPASARPLLQLNDVPFWISHIDERDLPSTRNGHGNNLPDDSPAGLYHRLSGRFDIVYCKSDVREPRPVDRGCLGFQLPTILEYLQRRPLLPVSGQT